MPAKANPRNHRNNPYVFDPFLANIHHSTAGVLWRFRTEATSLLATAAIIWQLAVAITIAWALITFVVLVTAAFITPPVGGTSSGEPGASFPVIACRRCSSKPGCTPGRDDCP